MAVDREQDEAAIVRASLELVLGCLPERLVPSRGFVTACSDFALALADAWLALYVIAVQSGSVSQQTRGADCSAKLLHEGDDALRSKLDSLVGASCSRAWWADATERLEKARPVGQRGQLQPEVPINGGLLIGGGGSSGSSTRATTPTPTPSVTGSGTAPSVSVAEASHLRFAVSDSQEALQAVLLTIMRRSLTSGALAGIRPQRDGGLERSGCPPVREDGDSSQSDLLQEQWLCFGVAWVLSALDDVIGSVVAHCRRKAAQPRGATVRPTSSTGRPGSGAIGRIGTAGQSRPGTSEQRPRTPAAEGSGVQQALERRRLLALKHFVGAVKADRDLQACTVLETCLVEVATGVAPHVEASYLLASPLYHQRLRLWAEQEAGQEPGAVDFAVKQAMKEVCATSATTPRTSSATNLRPSHGKGDTSETRGLPLRFSAPSRVAAGAERVAVAKAPARKSQGWLPQAFVQEFNAEGDEVDAEGFPSDAESDGIVSKEALGSLSVKTRVVFADRLEV